MDKVGAKAGRVRSAAAEFARRQARRLFEEFAEIVVVGDPDAVGDVLDAEVGLFEQFLRLLHPPRRDVLHDAHAEVLLRDLIELRARQQEPPAEDIARKIPREVVGDEFVHLVGDIPGRPARHLGKLQEGGDGLEQPHGGADGRRRVLRQGADGVQQLCVVGKVFAAAPEDLGEPCLLIFLRHQVREDGVADELAYAKVEDAIRLAKETGIDFLAPALGSVHGIYKGEPKLDFHRMKQIDDALQMPLVLHGGSGIGDDLIREAIHCGISKLNINTELQLAWNQAVREFIESNENVYDPRKVIKAGEMAMKQAIDHKLQLLGSVNKA